MFQTFLGESSAKYIYLLPLQSVCVISFGIPPLRSPVFSALKFNCPLVTLRCTTVVVQVRNSDAWGLLFNFVAFQTSLIISAVRGLFLHKSFRMKINKVVFLISSIFFGSVFLVPEEMRCLAWNVSICKSTICLSSVCALNNFQQSNFLSFLAFY